MKHIAVLLDLNNGHYRGLVRGMHRYMVDKAWIYHMAPSRPAFAPTLTEWQPDGVIGRLAGPELFEAVDQLGVPMVHLGLDGEGGHTTAVMPDAAATGRFAAEHLLSLGLNHFAYFGPVRTKSRLLQEKGFRTVLEEARRKVHSFILPAGTPPWHSWTAFDREVSAWLASLPKPVAVLAGHDGAGVELALVCQKMGLRVPEDVAVMGVGDDELRCGGVSPPLTSLALPSERMGFEAAAMLDYLMDGGTPPRRPTVLPPLHVVSRQSTDIIHTDEPRVAEAVRYIRAHAHEKIGVNHVLEKVAINRRHLERMFRRLLGRTPHQEITRVRIERAKRMLSGTDLSMQTIAERCGFDSARRLSSNFQSQVGTTPSAYRQQFELR